MSSFPSPASALPSEPGGHPAASHIASLEQLDDMLIDLLLRRQALRAQARALAAAGLPAPVLAPGRDAAVLRRLLGRLPREPAAARQMVSILREILALPDVTLAVCDTDRSGAQARLAREQFGALAAIRTVSSPAQAIGEMDAGNALAAVLPIPGEQDPGMPWWVALLHRDPRRDGVAGLARRAIVGRLPFWPRVEGGPGAADGGIAAYVLGAEAPVPSGADHTLIGLELEPGTSRGRLAAALAAAGLHAFAVLIRRAPQDEWADALVEVDGFVEEADPRLAALPGLIRPAAVLGAFPVPL